MSLNLSNPENNYLGPNHEDDIPIEQMGNFAENPQDRCPIALVVDVSGSMRDDIGMLNTAIEKFRDTVLTDPVATLRVEVALVAFNHQTEVRQEFTSIDEFDPGPLEAKGGTRMCQAVNRALDMIEERKDTYHKNQVGCYRPWLLIFTTSTPDLPARRLRELKEKREITTFVILGGDADTRDHLEQMNQFTDHVMPMKEASYDALLEWMAIPAALCSDDCPCVTGHINTMKMLDLSKWLEVIT